MFSTKSTKLILRGTLANQMKEVENLRTTDPVLFGRRFALGDDLIRFCENGELRKLMDAVHGAQDGDILFYFAVKMFHKALINGHMMIASFLLDQGYPLHSTGIPNPLTEAIAVVEDFRAIAIIEFLVLGKNMDINIQPSPTYFAPIHIAVKRGLVDTVEYLLAHGADANAVAAADAMPLTLAEALTPSSDKDEIIDLLLRKGAKNTWRTNSVDSSSIPKTVFKSFSGGGAAGGAVLKGAVGGGGGGMFTTFNPSVQSTMVSFKAGGAAGMGTQCMSASSVTVEYATGMMNGSAHLHGLLSGVSEGTNTKNSSMGHQQPGPRTRTTFSSDFSSQALNSGQIDATADGKVLPAVRVSSGATHNGVGMTSGGLQPVNGGGNVLRTHTNPRVTKTFVMSEAHSEMIGTSTDRGGVLSSIIEDKDEELEEDKNETTTMPDPGFRLSDDGAFIFSTHS